jgi:16S rRNA (adenine(1408)-N(1))-methyltransferase
MRILRGTTVVEAEPGWREALSSSGRPVIIDVGTGDGRFVYESARRDPASFYIGVDPDAAALAEYAYRASRKPARGGVDNAAFVIASVEQLPVELNGLAALVRVNFPWGSLLRGLLEPGQPVLEALARLAVDGHFEIVLAYDPEHDFGAFAGEALPPLSEALIEATLRPAYSAAGLQVDQYRRLTQDEALAIPSTWGRRLLHGRPRPVYWLSGNVVSSPEGQIG